MNEEMATHLTYSFHVFFCLQIFSIFICRITFEPIDVFRKTMGLFGGDPYGDEYDLDPTKLRQLPDFISTSERNSNRLWFWIQWLAITVVELLMLVYGRETMKMKQIGLLSTD